MIKIKKITKLLILTGLSLMLTSCAVSEEEKGVSIWYYEYDGGPTDYNVVAEKAVDYIKRYAEINEMKIEIMKYSYRDLGYNDYVLKRNSAIERGDVDIILDNLYSLYSIRKYSGDYSGLDNYENITSSFNEGFCIPVAYKMDGILVNDELLQKYRINSDKVITIEDYYSIKQKMKENGARFKLNGTELHELIEYYILKNNLKIENKDGSIVMDKNIMVNILNGVYNELDKYYNVYEIKDSSENDESVYDKNYGINLVHNHTISALNLEGYGGEPDAKSYTIAVANKAHNTSSNVNDMPWVLVNKGSKAEDVYKLAGTLFGDGFQCLLYDEGYGVVANNYYVMKYIGFEEDGRYTGRKTVDAAGNVIRINKYYSQSSERQLFEMVEKGYEAMRNQSKSDVYADNLFRPEFRGFIIRDIHSMLDERG